MNAVGLLKDLVAIDSTNPTLVAGGAGEGEIAAFVARWLERAGLEVTVEEAGVGRPNVVGVARGRGGGRSLLLNAHTDTVGASGMQAPHTPRIDGDRLYGRGAYDMKAGLAAAMLTAAKARRLGLAGDVVVAAVVDEEAESIGTETLVRNVAADAAIVTEPTGLDICIAHRGFVWADIETLGRAAHGSRPDLGVDAIAKMGPVLVDLERLGAALAAGMRHPLLGTGSVHASTIEGGRELSTYPDRCVLRIERRTIPGESVEQVETELKQFVDGGDVRVTFSRAPLETSPHEPIVETLGRQIRSAGSEPELAARRSGRTPASSQVPPSQAFCSARVARAPTPPLSGSISANTSGVSRHWLLPPRSSAPTSARAAVRREAVPGSAALSGRARSASPGGNGLARGRGRRSQPRTEN